jgi:hypothetical protein
MASDTFGILLDLVVRVSCKPEWHFRLTNEDKALRLVISVTGPDASNPNQDLTVSHYFPVPTTTYNERTWRRWLFERCRGVENHELGEWFRVDGERPFAPLHGPGEDPYTVHEYREDIDRRIRQDGIVRDKQT